MKPILTLSIGSSNVKALIYDETGSLINESQETLEPFHPKHGEVEYNPETVFNALMMCVYAVLLKTNINRSNLHSIGITNTRGSVVIWDKDTGKPIWNAISYIDERKGTHFDLLQSKQAMIKEKTGKHLSHHAPALKIRWILDETKKEGQNLLFGSLGTYVLWKLTKGKAHITDMTNACSSMLFNVCDKVWDKELLTLFKIPESILPEVKSCSEVYASTNSDIFGAQVNISSMITKSQGALLGSGCFKQGLHAFFGTSTFLQRPTGSTCTKNHQALNTSVSLHLNNDTTFYCQEGAIYSSGGVFNWLMNHLGLIRSINEIEGLAYSVPDSLGAIFVPSLNGLSFTPAPLLVRGSFLGLTSNTNIGHLCRATIEGLALLVANLFDISQAHEKMKCSGGMSENTFLMQMCSGLIGQEIVRPKELDTASLGAAFLAGLATGLWKDLDEIKSLYKPERTFHPELSESDRKIMKERFKNALDATLLFSEKE